MRIRATSTVSGKQERAPSAVGPWRRDSVPPVPGNPVLGLQSTHGNRAVLRMLDRPAALVVQGRGCSCDGAVGGGCTGCAAEPSLLQRRESTETGTSQSAVAGVVDSVLRLPGQPLNADVREYLEPRFGYDFGQVRIHADARAAASADAVHARAYTVGHNIVFANGAYAPDTDEGRRLLAHELTHTIQQRHAGPSIAATPLEIGTEGDPAEREADTVAERALSATGAGPIAPRPDHVVARQQPSAPKPWITKVTVDLTPPQDATLEWRGTPPADAPGTDNFAVSTGKGYRDPWDDENVCKRGCCADAKKQCASPHDRPGAIGSCCTPKGSDFQTGRTEQKHNGYNFWTRVEPIYGDRGIALHQYPDEGVTGQAIGHGCVRMQEPNAERIARFKRVGVTRVVIGGDASPVACPDDRKCEKKPQLVPEPSIPQTAGQLAGRTASGMPPDGEVVGPAGPDLPEDQPASVEGDAPEIAAAELPPTVQTPLRLARQADPGAEQRRRRDEQQKRDPCTPQSCSPDETKLIQQGLNEAIGHTGRTIEALASTRRMSKTSRALIDVFRSNSEATVGTVRTRLGYILDCLRDTLYSPRWGCYREPRTVGGRLVGAHVDVDQDLALGGHDRVPVCIQSGRMQFQPTLDVSPGGSQEERQIRKMYVTRAMQQRITTFVHECAHRRGIDHIVRPRGREDVDVPIDPDTPMPGALDREYALVNPDSYGIFVWRVGPERDQP